MNVGLAEKVLNKTKCESDAFRAFCFLVPLACFLFSSDLSAEGIEPNLKEQNSAIAQNEGTENPSGETAEIIAGQDVTPSNIVHDDDSRVMDEPFEQIIMEPVNHTIQTEQSPVPQQFPHKDHQANIWKLDGSKTLKSNLDRWLTVSGWKLAWEIDHDFQVGADAELSCTIDEAVERVVAAYRSKGVLFKVTWYEGNRILQIGQMHAENELAGKL